ncbi:MAG TPA: BadF/BadG/BcrA/BcrD ATPase family protein [Bacillales bacterium]|nr:BadF/BadG/BcrA/BcrD ATPase family protein [Bacillales bacterium]
MTDQAEKKDFILGVDAGNTKTLAVLATQKGEILGIGRGVCGDIYGALSAEAAISEVKNAVDVALAKADANKQDIHTAAFSMAGADWPEDYEFLKNTMKNHSLGKEIVITNDAMGGLRAGSQVGYGVSVILGTGVAIGAKGYNESSWHGSHWIRGLDSNHLIEEIINVVLLSELRIGPSTSLTNRVLHLFSKEKIEDFLHAITQRGNKENKRKTKMMRALLEEADNSDEVAQEIVQCFAERCGDFALTAARKANFQQNHSFHLVFSGGMFRHSSRLITNIVTARVHTKFPGAVPVLSQFEPVIGALFLGFDAANIRISEKIKGNLKESMPVHY